MMSFRFGSIIFFLLLIVYLWCGSLFVFQTDTQTTRSYLQHERNDIISSDNFIFHLDPLEMYHRKLVGRELDTMEYKKFNKDILSNSIDSFFMSRNKPRRKPPPKSLSRIPKEVLERIGLGESNKSHIENLLINIGEKYNKSVDYSYLSSLSMSRLFRPLPPNSVAAVDNTSCKLHDPYSADTNTNHHLILVFVDSRFFPLYHNWHLHFLDICGQDRISQLELVCMDEEVINPLSSLGLKCSTHSFVIASSTSAGMYAVKRQASVWIKRMEVILFYLQQGMDLLLADTDAIWRSDPYVDLNRLYSSADIIASKGSFPGTLFQSWGATICMGYIFLKSSPFSTMFMEAVLQDMRMKAVIMERIQEEIVVRKRLLPQEGEKYPSRKSNFKNTLKEKTLGIKVGRKQYRTKRSIPNIKSQENSVQQEQHRMLLFQELDNKIDEPEEPDIPDHSNIADNLGADEDMEPSSIPFLGEKKANEHAEEDEDEDEIDGDVVETNQKYSSSEVAQWTNWIRSNDISIYLPALTRFHNLLLTHKLSVLFPAHNASQDEARRNMDILHFLYDVRDLEGNKPDDQYAVNYALYHWQVKWDRKPMHVVEGKSYATDHGSILLDPAERYSSSIITALWKPVRSSTVIKRQNTLKPINGSVLLLPHYTYLRNCTGIPYNRRTRSLGYRNAKMAVARKDVVVAHCLLSPGDAKKKYMSLKSFKLWHHDAPRLTTSLHGMSNSLLHGQENRNISSYAESLYAASRRVYGKSKLNISSIAEEREKAYKQESYQSRLEHFKKRVKEKRKKKARRNRLNNQ